MTDALAQTLDTDDGPFTIVANEEEAVLASGWTDDVDAVIARMHPTLRPRSLRWADLGAAEAVLAYYEGDLTAVDEIPVQQAGTAQQRAGWDVLRGIAAGEPLSYAQFAAELGAPRAVRAAASICARNAPALFVPCHRVRRSDGSLGGFAWGLDVKRSLLGREAKVRGGFPRATLTPA